VGQDGTVISDGAPVTSGRSAVVGPDQPAPSGWEGCERVAVDALDEEIALELHRRWRSRQSCVYELRPHLRLDDPLRPPAETVTGRQPWEWPVDLVLAEEWAHHALWANSVDARRPGPPAWRWATEALGLGARPCSAGGADVVLADGTPALCDGGPLDASLAGRIGGAVLHRVSIEHRSLRPLGAPSEVAGLAPDQAAAVAEPRAGARIIAPAGSGKTRVLTERARSLLADWGLPPAAVALVAYNVRAAGEMRDRLADRQELRIRTLNALGLRLCGRSTTIEETEVRRILAELVKFPRRAEADPVAPWIEALSRVRLGLVAPDLVEDEVGDVTGLDGVTRSYRAQLARRDVVDFDDQIAVAIERLLADPAFRARSQRAARVLLVDEFQDLTPAHMLLLRLLSGPAGAVFGVGDDDQTIYGYAGATPRWLVDFDEWFPGSASHPLEVNYRCPVGVVDAATNVLTRNAVRVAKTIRPGPAAAPDGLRVISDCESPSAATAAEVASLLDSGAHPSEIAVLSRVNAALVPVRVLMGHHGIPVNSTGDGRFLQRGGVRAALAWLDLATASSSSKPASSIREAAKRPKRGMSPSLVDLLARSRSIDSIEGLSAWLEGKGSGRDAEKVDAFASDVSLIRETAGRGTAAVLRAIRSRVGGGGLDSSASALDQWSHGAIAAHSDDLDALTELAALEPDPARFGPWLAERLAAPADPGGVTLASIHAVKGREWPRVVLHNVTDGLLPHRLAGDSEEERRIFHVGLTRGSASVTVVAGRPASPFVIEMGAPGAPGPRPARAVPATRATTPARSSPSSSAPVEWVAASPGLEFSAGGHDHTVAEAGPAGATCVIGSGPARTVTAYGRSVTVAGRAVVLAHPSVEVAFERLRAWRSERAQAAAVPAYVVFDDKTLRLIAITLPTTEAGLLSLKGIGPAKFESYGSDLLALAEELRAEELRAGD
jgi:DNA helicase-2/ATP-dependent DNA helicase PcrA